MGWRRFLWGFVAVLLLVTIAYFTRSVFESRRCFLQGQSAAAVGDWNSAILDFRHGVEWYAPIGSKSEQALLRLVEIGDARRTAGDEKTALFAYRSARVGALAVGHLLMPYGDTIKELNERIAHLMSEQSTSLRAREKQYAATLNNHSQRIRSPALGFAAGLFFLFWLGSLGLIATRGFKPTGQRTKGLGWYGLLSVFLLTACLCLVRIS
jgi:hypothetical protein